MLYKNRSLCPSTHLRKIKKIVLFFKKKALLFSLYRKRIFHFVPLIEITTMKRDYIVSSFLALVNLKSYFLSKNRIRKEKKNLFDFCLSPEMNFYNMLEKSVNIKNWT
jgi:hypothetical protein